MGICFSGTKVSGSNGNNGAAAKKRRKANTKPKLKAVSAKAKANSKHVPWGKRTDFGYDKNFYKRYSLGKFLGHGQFGYTYVGIDKANGDRVAVKRLEKNKVLSFSLQSLLNVIVIFISESYTNKQGFKLRSRSRSRLVVFLNTAENC